MIIRNSADSADIDGASEATLATLTTSAQVIDNAIHTGDVAVTGYATVGAVFDDVAPAAVTENKTQSVRMSSRRELYSQLRDAAGNERGVNVNASNALLTTQTGELPAGTQNIGDVDILSIASGTNEIGSVGIKKYTVPATGELAGSITAAQMPNVACNMVNFKAVLSNAGNVYVGISGVTRVDGTTDTTTGFELGPGDETGFIPVDNLNRFYRICNNAGDDLTYISY